MSALQFELPVGLTYRNVTQEKSVVLARLNGLAEKIVAKRLQDAPYTWQANVLAASIRQIGDIEICNSVRETFAKKEIVEVPDAVTHLTLADTNTLLLVIHRELWKAELKDQQFLCKACSKNLTRDIDLRKIDLTQEDKDFLATNPNLTEVVVYLKYGFTLSNISGLEGMEDYKGITFNKITYRPPLLKDAIKNEKYADDELAFWHRLAADCVVKVESVDNPDTPEESFIAEAPDKVAKFAGLKLYNDVLDREDLAAIREELQGYLPTYPFLYEDNCPCPLQAKVPHIMEASSFFSV